MITRCTVASCFATSVTCAARRQPRMHAHGQEITDIFQQTSRKRFHIDSLVVAGPEATIDTAVPVRGQQLRKG